LYPPESDFENVRLLTASAASSKLVLKADRADNHPPQAAVWKKERYSVRGYPKANPNATFLEEGAAASSTLVSSDVVERQLLMPSGAT
jgi:hypothetical protein